MLSEHSRKHSIVQTYNVLDIAEAEVALIVTASCIEGRADVDLAIAALSCAEIPFGVIHNETNPPVPSPGNYPSFAWTETAMRQLESYSPILVRQPLFLPIVPRQVPLSPHFGTFGVAEPKKQTVELAQWAKSIGVPFSVFVPDDRRTNINYGDYLDAARQADARVIIYPWHDRLDYLAPMFDDVTHFIFSLVPTKSGSGGSSTSARYAPLFNRHVVVVDDEWTTEQDGFTVFPSMQSLYDKSRGILGLTQPSFSNWDTDAYLDELIKHLAPAA